MKKFFCLLLLVFIGQVVFAQNKPSQDEGKKKKKTDKFLFGVGGFQLASITGDASSYDSPLPGFVVGFGIKLVDFGNNWSVITDLEYSQQGSKYKDTYASGKAILGYLNLPIVGRYRTKSGFFGEAGLQPGILLSAKDKVGGSTYDFKDQVKSFDLAVPLGVGFGFQNGFDVEVRVAPGLLNLNKEGNDKSHNLVSGLRVAFNF